MDDNGRMTLDEFLENDLDRAWVEEEGLASLYVRKGMKALHDSKGKVRYFTNVFTVASVSAETPGDGAFSRLVKKLEEKWDGPIFVEQVLAEEFMPALFHLGFGPTNPLHDFGGLPRNFVKHIDKGRT